MSRRGSRNDFEKKLEIDVDADFDFDVDVKFDKKVDVDSDIDAKTDVEGNSVVFAVDAEAVGKDTFVNVEMAVVAIEDELSSFTAVGVVAVD